MTPLGTLWTELPPELLLPSVAAFALVGGLVARLAVAAGWRVAAWHRGPRALPWRGVDAIEDGQEVTLRGELAVDAAGSATLRAHGVSFALEGAPSVRGGRGVVRGVYRRRPEERSGEAYRDAPTRHTIVAGPSGTLEVTPLGEAPPARLGWGFALLGALVGGVVGMAAPSAVAPRVLASPPRVPHLRVRSIEPFRVVLERVPEEMDPTCAWRARTPARWNIERAECAPTLTLVSPAPGLRDIVPRRLAGPTARAAGRSIALALGWPELAAELAVAPGDAGAYRTAIRESFAAGDDNAVWHLARQAPPAAYPEVAAEVLTTYLFSHRAEADAGAFARTVAAAAPTGTSASLACIEAFWDWPAARPAAEALAFAMRPGAPPACVILGATTARRGLDSLRPLEALARDSAVWRPVVDAAKNFVLLEGLASGTIRAPAPSRFGAFGDAAELRDAMPPGVAHLIEATAGILEARGDLRLAWQTGLPAREAIVRSLLFDAPEALWSDRQERLVADWAERVTAGYRAAGERFAQARSRDRRLDDAALQRLRAERSRFEAELPRLRAHAQALRAVDSLGVTNGPWTFDPTHAPAVTAAARDALRSGDVRAFAAALGAPSIASLVTAAVVGQRPAGARDGPCRIDPVACAWAFDALRDPAAATQPWRDRSLARDFGHRQANFELYTTLLVHLNRSVVMHLPQYPRYGYGGPLRVEPRPAAAAFVLAVTEALQRSLAGAR